MPRFEFPPCAGRLPVRLDNCAVRKRALEVGIIRQRIGNAPENALDKRRLSLAVTPRSLFFPLTGGAMRARTASAEAVPSSFMVKPALFASCALDGAC